MFKAYSSDRGNQLPELESGVVVGGTQAGIWQFVKRGNHIWSRR